MNKNKTIIGGIAIAIIAIIIIAIAVSKNMISPYKRQVLTEENFGEVMEKAKIELNEDEEYYLSYITLKNLFVPDNLYGKTVNQLIKDGKKEMKKDGYTVEKYKKELEKLNSSTNPEEEEKESISSKITEINNEFVVGIWNELFCNVSHYLDYGKDSIGEEFDFDKAMKKADLIMSKKDEYDTFMNNLSDDYKELKEVWNKILPETEKLYDKLKKDRPTAMDEDYDFDVERYIEYMYDFQSLVY